MVLLMFDAFVNYTTEQTTEIIKQLYTNYKFTF